MKILATVLLASLAIPSIANAQDLAVGDELFMRYCATCHGLEARGNGPTASILTLEPTDLTALAAENNGVFPISAVIARVDGRDPLIAHGSPMPIFGEYFEGRGETIRGEHGTLIMTSQPIIDLVHYIESLQE